MAETEASPIERWRQVVSRIGLTVIAALFVAGLVLWALREAIFSTHVFHIATVLLMAMPVLTMMAALAEEIRRRDWPFVCAAGLVMLLLAYSAIRLG